MIKIYTDGSCIGNPGQGGWAAIILDEGKKTEIKGNKKNSQFKLNKKKVKNLIRGYEGIKKISGIEKKSLNILCRAAAMRYFLTRLYDYTNTPKTALIKIKDPREYYQKLIIHNNLKNYRDYLI